MSGSSPTSRMQARRGPRRRRRPPNFASCPRCSASSSRASSTASWRRAVPRSTSAPTRARTRARSRASLAARCSPTATSRAGCGRRAASGRAGRGGGDGPARACGALGSVRQRDRERAFRGDAPWARHGLGLPTGAKDGRNRPRPLGGPFGSCLLPSLRGRRSLPPLSLVDRLRTFAPRGLTNRNHACGRRPPELHEEESAPVMSSAPSRAPDSRRRSWCTPVSTMTSRCPTSSPIWACPSPTYSSA